LTTLFKVVKSYIWKNNIPLLTYFKRFKMSKQKPKKQVHASSTTKASYIQTSESKKDWLFLIPLVVTFLAFFPTFENDFVNWDDASNITENRWIQSLSLENLKGMFTNNILGNYNPLPILTFAIEKAIFGIGNLATVVHTNNLLLHLLCVYLVFRLSGEMGLKRWGAVFVALLFGIHPMRVESVAWATERKDVLFAAFYFAALLSYVKYLKSNSYSVLNKNMLICFGFFILSLFSKVQAVALPLSLLALDYYFRRPLKFNIILEKAHFFIGSLAIGLINITTLITVKSLEQASLNFSIFDRILMASHSFAVYIGKFVFPWQMIPVYTYPPKIPTYFYATALVFFISVVGAIWAHRKGWKTIVFGWLFFFFNFIFVSQIVSAGQGFLADRFTYIGYFGLFFLVISLSERIVIESYKYIKYAFAAYLALCFFMTWNQVKVWKNGETLWTHQIEQDPVATIGWQNRGTWLRDNQQSQKALSDFNTALTLNQKDAGLYNSRGKTLAEMGQFTPAIHDFTMAIHLKPNMLDALSNRGAAYGALNKIDSTLADLTAVLAIDSLDGNALLNRGMAYDVLGNVEASIKDFTKVIELEPLNTTAFLNRMQGYRKLNKLDLALSDCDSYLNLKKDNPDLWVDRALLKSRTGRCAEAIPDFNEAIALNGSNGAVFAERARCHFQTGNLPQAKADATKAMQFGGQQYVDPRWLK
jgi:protein O-mannosyl-transferase